MDTSLNAVIAPKIGTLQLSSPFVLAPLAGYTDLAFRILCRELGASLCFSEMVSCHGLVYQQKNTLVLLNTVAEERPVGIQLFGSDPEVMGKAAALVSNYPIDVIDINMGCPVRKVIKKGAGSALMKTPELAHQIITTVCAHTTLPVTVKFRSGWTHENITAVQFGQMAEAAGASAITVHARTWSQGFGGYADWDVVQQVKEAVSIPVFGNGDVLSYQQGIQRMEETGCDGIMVGRGALGNPWVFAPKGRPQTLAGRLGQLVRHMELSSLHLPAEKMLFRIKNHAGRYCAELPGAARIRKAIYDCNDMDELLLLVQTESTTAAL
ncbi:MAG: tRNA dihydrouridine synthase DusB [Desulfobulbus propionicus]|nr:MAG: tRNA dihydrouridine synthase DusB [Desulfobulbus propionicus]